MVKKLVPTETGRILSTCSVLQVAYAAAQFEQARSADKDQGEATVLKWPLEGVLVGQKYFIVTLSTVFVSKLRRYVKKIPEKMDQEKSYTIQERTWLFDRNRVE